MKKTKADKQFAFQQLSKIDLPRRRQGLAHSYNPTISPALQWGLDHEPDAQMEYEKQPCRIVNRPVFCCFQVEISLAHPMG